MNKSQLTKNRMLAPEGKGIVIWTLLILIFSTVGGLVFGLNILKIVSIVALLFLVLCGIFFRNPRRQIPEGENLILSPADGKVVFVGEVEDDDGLTKQVSIFLSIFDVHANRVPISGLVKKVRYTRGKFLAAFKSEASIANEQTEIQIQNDNCLVKVKQIAGLIARRIICNLSEGEIVAKGDRLGFIRFGSRTDLLMPAEVKIHVINGDKVRGGETIIGELV